MSWKLVVSSMKDSECCLGATQNLSPKAFHPYATQPATYPQHLYTLSTFQVKFSHYAVDNSVCNFVCNSEVRSMVNGCG